MDRAIQMLADYFGETDERSAEWPFDFTDYYELEMGENLRRRFVSFERVINPAELPGVKSLTNQLESRICYECGLEPGRRAVNLDPGYITLGKLVLATTKDYAHRVYLRDGIYAESTLYYEKSGKWLPWPWTYPDYASPRYHEFFLAVRERLKDKLTSS
jgi:hypothetical protein